MSDDDTILERDYAALGDGADALLYAFGARRLTEHPSVAAWRHAANMWRDRCHAQAAKAALWRSLTIGMTIGMVLGIAAWRLWS